MSVAERGQRRGHGKAKRLQKTRVQTCLHLQTPYPGLFCMPAVAHVGEHVGQAVGDNNDPQGASVELIATT